MSSEITGPSDGASIYAQVGMNVRRHRLCKKITVAELAERVGLSEQQIEDYEQGRTEFSSSELLVIASAMGLSVERFFAGVQIRHDPSRLS